MASPVDICNMALGRIGVSTLIASLDATRNLEERTCALWYPIMRDFALSEYEWRFASRRVSLALLDEDPPTNWGYRYAYPTDCLKARRLVYPGLYSPRADQRLMYEVVSNGTSRVIDTNIEDAELEYTMRVEDTEQFPPLFVSALAYLIASELVMPLSKKPDVGQAMRNAYVLVSSSAAAHSMSEAEEGPAPENEFTAARGATSAIPDGRIDPSV